VAVLWQRRLRGRWEACERLWTEVDWAKVATDQGCSTDYERRDGKLARQTARPEPAVKTALKWTFKAGPREIRPISGGPRELAQPLPPGSEERVDLSQSAHFLRNSGAAG
jgi:hypothetical protein